MKRLVIFTLLFTFVLSACQPAAQTPEVTVTPEATATSIHTATAVSSPTITATAPRNPNIAEPRPCPEVKEKYSEIISPGVLVIWDLLGTGNRVFLWDSSRGTSIDLPGEAERSYPPHILVSPNRKWLAYFEYLENPEHTLGPVRLSIADSGGNLIKTQENNWKYWTGLVNWLDDEHLMLDKFLDGSMPHPIQVMNPFTGDSSVIYADYPEVWKDTQHYMAWWANSSTSMAIYDSGLQLVIYPIGSSEIVLFDITTKNELARMDIGNLYGSEPQWSLDFRKFVVDLSKPGNDPFEYYVADELYAIDRAGQKTKLTDFTKTFPEVDIQEYSWSPDGTRIAFWFSTQPEDEHYELAVLDVTNLNIAKYCVSDDIRRDQLTLFAPVWSPDATQLLVRGSINGVTNLEDANVILVDIQRNFVSQIRENAIPVGWMVNIP